MSTITRLLILAAISASLISAGCAATRKEPYIPENAVTYVLPKCNEDDLPVVYWHDDEWRVACYPADDPRVKE